MFLKHFLHLSPKLLFKTGLKGNRFLWVQETDNIALQNIVNLQLFFLTLYKNLAHGRIFAFGAPFAAPSPVSFFLGMRVLASLASPRRHGRGSAGAKRIKL